MANEIEIVPLEATHFEGVVALQALCFPPPFDPQLLWQTHHLKRHRELFPAGQHVAVKGGKVIGSSTCMILSESNWQQHADWEATTGGHNLAKHDPRGTTLYGVDISVHPEYRGLGVGKALYRARFAVVQSCSLWRFGTACRMPDFGSALVNSPALTPEEYAQSVASGALRDRTLSPLLKMGVRLTGVIEGHMDDEESGHAAAILEWSP